MFSANTKDSEKLDLWWDLPKRKEKYYTCRVMATYMLSDMQNATPVE